MSGEERKIPAWLKNMVNRPMPVIPYKTDDIQQGQIWSVETTDPAAEEDIFFLVTMAELGNEATQKLIRVAPISFDIPDSIPSDRDFVVRADEGPIGVGFLVELWNERPMYVRTLKEMKGACHGLIHRPVMRQINRLFIDARAAIYNETVDRWRIGLPILLPTGPIHVWREKERARFAVLSVDVYRAVGTEAQAISLKPPPGTETAHWRGITPEAQAMLVKANRIAFGNDKPQADVTVDCPRESVGARSTRGSRRPVYEPALVSKKVGFLRTTLLIRPDGYVAFAVKGDCAPFIQYRFGPKSKLTPITAIYEKGDMKVWHLKEKLKKNAEIEIIAGPAERLCRIRIRINKPGVRRAKAAATFVNQLDALYRMARKFQTEYDYQSLKDDLKALASVSARAPGDLTAFLAETEFVTFAALVRPNKIRPKIAKILTTDGTPWIRDHIRGKRK